MWEKVWLHPILADKALQILVHDLEPLNPRDVEIDLPRDYNKQNKHCRATILPQLTWGVALVGMCPPSHTVSRLSNVAQGSMASKTSTPEFQGVK